MTRRHRSITWTVVTAALVFIIMIFLFFNGNNKHHEYIPGEKVAGVTNTLARGVPADAPHIRFKNVTDSAGIDFTHFSGQRSTQLPEDMGSGAAWIDYDNDGWPDLFVVNEVGPLTMTPAQIRQSKATCRLYHNNHDGTFTDVTKKAGINFKGWGMGVAVGDYNNDGYPDIFITAYGKNVLYKNNGNGTFTNVTAKAGVGGIKGFWTGARWGDYDRDGNLDLYVAGYVRYSKLPSSSGVSKRANDEEPASINPLSFPPQRNLLYHNNGNGTFTERAIPAGVADFTGKSLSVAWCDFDGDGWPDLYVANDVSDNVLYHNQHNGTFMEISHPAHVADYRGAMGLAIGDWNQDGTMDLFITHWLAEENTLYDNIGKLSRGSYIKHLTFKDESDAEGLGQISLDYVGWGTSFFDYDNDTRPDLLVVNGSTDQSKDDPHKLVPMHPQLFWNGGAKKGFYDVTSLAGPAFKKNYVSRGAAFADYNRNGRMDVFIVNLEGHGVLLENEGPVTNNWIEIKLQGTKSNRSAIGARLTLVTGKIRQIREVGAQPSYLSQNDLTQHFGLAQATKVDSLYISWPSGLHQTFEDLPVNRLIHIREGSHTIR